MRTFEWAIEEIGEAHPDLYLDHHTVMAVALMLKLSASPCEFLVNCEGFSPPALDGEQDFLLQVSWQPQTAEEAARMWLTEQPKPVIERGAIALAALTFAHLVRDGEMRVTEHGHRADFWLPRLHCALEISGTEHVRELPRRHREKKAQVLANPWGWDGYVFLCCFSAERRFIRWSYHSQED